MKRSFLSGAVILMIANVISKVLGAVLKIPLTYIIHEEGMAVYNTAFSVYIMFLSFVVSGMPFAVQKLTAAAHAKGNAPGAKQTVALATAILAAAGIIGAVIMWCSSDFLALAMKEERAGTALRAMAPSVLFVALGTAVKSGFQGNSDMLPTAVSQVVEAFIKLFAGYYLAVVTIRLGTEFAAAGAASGVTIGEAAATLMLVLWYIAAYKEPRMNRGNARVVVNELGEIALPLLFISIVLSALSVCETSVLRASLLRSGLSADDARFIYGAYTGYALTILNLPTGFLATLGINIIPIVSGAAAVGNGSRIRSAAFMGIGICAAAGVASSLGIYFFGELILKLLFHNTASAPMLALGAPSVAFICVMQMCGAILQSMGHIRETFIASAAAAVIKLICSAVLASMPALNIYGAIIGTDAAFFVGMVISLIFTAVLVKKSLSGRSLR